VHDEEVAVTSRDANAKFLRLMKTLLSTPELLIRQQFGSFAKLPAIDLETNSADDAASPHSQLIGRCQSSGCGVSIVAARIAKNSPAGLCTITLPNHLDFRLQIFD
jgi:hypothetical protein